MLRKILLLMLLLIFVSSDSCARSPTPPMLPPAGSMRLQRQGGL